MFGITNFTNEDGVFSVSVSGLSTPRSVFLYIVIHNSSTIFLTSSVKAGVTKKSTSVSAKPKANGRLRIKLDRLCTKKGVKGELKY